MITTTPPVISRLYGPSGRSAETTATVPAAACTATVTT